MESNFPDSVPIIESVTKCENCAAETPPAQKFCSSCSFPVNGTNQEKTSFRLTVSSRKRLLTDANDKVKSGKIAIYVLAGIFFVSGLITFLVNDDVVTFIVSLVICVIYLVLAAWVEKNPFGAMLTAFILYATIQIINAFVDPATIFGGIILKVFVIAAFIKGIRSALDAQKLLKELEKLKASPGGI
jgi:hypothetical protein